MTRLRCRTPLIEETLHSLRVAGCQRRESIVLWLGAPTTTLACVDVAETYVPRHEAEHDWFRVPPDAMREMMGHLRTRHLAVIAQVHSHPQEAFHSRADDAWAIPSRVGALSIVVPRFAHDVTPDRFMVEAALFRLSDEGKWVQIGRAEAPQRLEITS